MVTGQCLCGKVRFEIEGDLGETRLCYCELCRRANGGAFSANIPVAVGNYRLLLGSEHIREFESSPGAFRAFCSNCGSPVYARVANDPAHLRIRLGTLGKETRVRGAPRVCGRSKPAWDATAHKLPQYEPRPAGPLMPAASAPTPPRVPPVSAWTPAS